MKKNVAFSCFVDANTKFEREVMRWLWSLVENLGVQPRDIYITCDPKVSSSLVSFFGEFDGLNVAYEKCFTESSKPANKWLQLKQLCGQLQDYTHFVITDCDKVFVEFSTEWCDDSIRACRFIPRPTFAIFEDLFSRHFGTIPRFVIERPDPQDVNRDGRNYVNNHNGGLIIIPASKLTVVTNRWKEWIDKLLEQPEVLCSNVRNLDQVAFALAMHELGSDINFLPATFDLGPNISGVSPFILKPGSGQLVLHIHGSEDEDGRILCGDSVPDHYRELIEQINSRYICWKERSGLLAA